MHWISILAVDFKTQIAKEDWRSLPTWMCCEIFFPISSWLPWYFLPVKVTNCRKQLFTWYFLAGLRYKISNSFPGIQVEKPILGLDERWGSGFAWSAQSPIKWKQCCRIHLLTAYFLHGPQLFYLRRNNQTQKRTINSLFSPKVVLQDVFQFCKGLNYRHVVCTFSHI